MLVLRSIIYISQDLGATPAAHQLDEWGGKVQCLLIHTVEYYLAVKRTKLPFAIIQMVLESVMPVKQVKRKGKDCMESLLCEI